MDNTKIANKSLNHSCFNKSFLIASRESQATSNHSASLQLQIFFITVLKNLQQQPKFAKSLEALSSQLFLWERNSRLQTNHWDLIFYLHHLPLCQKHILERYPN